MTLQLIPSQFPYTVYKENLIFFFISVCIIKIDYELSSVLFLSLVKKGKGGGGGGWGWKGDQTRV
jgi:hypothetical protein